jgi:hypothetical protein
MNILFEAKEEIFFPALSTKKSEIFTLTIHSSRLLLLFKVMGFFCYKCNKKVRGQPIKHGCTRKKYGKNANSRVYDQSGNKGHRRPPSSRGFICFELRDKGYCERSNCCYSHNFQRSGSICEATREGRKCGNFNKCLHSHLQCAAAVEQQNSAEMTDAGASQELEGEDDLMHSDAV